MVPRNSSGVTSASSSDAATAITAVFVPWHPSQQERAIASIARSVLPVPLTTVAYSSLQSVPKHHMSTHKIGLSSGSCEV